jgi:hypothetical protein
MAADGTWHFFCHQGIIHSSTQRLSSGAEHHSFKVECMEEPVQTTGCFGHMSHARACAGLRHTDSGSPPLWLLLDWLLDSMSVGLHRHGFQDTSSAHAMDANTGISDGTTLLSSLTAHHCSVVLQCDITVGASPMDGCHTPWMLTHTVEPLLQHIS